MEQIVDQYLDQILPYYAIMSLLCNKGSLSHSQIPKVALPKYKAWGDILNWVLQVPDMSAFDIFWNFTRFLHKKPRDLVALHVLFSVCWFQENADENSPR